MRRRDHSRGKYMTVLTETLSEISLDMTDIKAEKGNSKDEMS